MGIAMMIMGGLMLLGYVASPSDFNVVDLILYLIIVIGGVIFFVFGKKRERLIKNAEKYSKYIDGKEQLDLNDLSGVVGIKQDNVINDLEQLIDKNYLVDVYIDHNARILFFVEDGTTNCSKNHKVEECIKEHQNDVDNKVENKLKKETIVTDAKSIAKQVEKRVNEEKQKREEKEANMSGEERYKALKFKKVYRNYIFALISFMPTVLAFQGLSLPEGLLIFGMFAGLIFIYIGVTNIGRMYNSCKKCGSWMSLELMEEEVLEVHEEHRHEKKLVGETKTTYKDRYGHQFNKNLVAEEKHYAYEDYDVLVGTVKCTYKCKECGEIVVRNEKREKRK